MYITGREELAVELSMNGEKMWAETVKEVQALNGVGRIQGHRDNPGEEPDRRENPVCGRTQK